ncbi:hypothetical protein [Aquella oligotrophica]|uniref:Uncharacterized protein n=1 Tax=Aquella oligotrophica TaxID=2067065 RepID=A0A2I7N328_9NEIS|nr:hypothetical protein [Aquella oligotrophica]AUR50849.1 hypothetical protein CUN60_00550 [Aquella oligotrophica]
MKNLTTKTFVHGRSRRIQNLALAGITAAVLSACGGGSGGCCTVPPNGNSQLIFVAPSILPSLANKTGINYMGVYNPSDVAISGIKYSVGQQVGSGNSITMDQASALACANIAAKSSCYLKFSVPESTIAGGTVVSAIDSNGAEAATPLAIGVQQVPYSESANANGVGLYFYPKAQYSESGVPFILVTAVVQSPNVGTINTIELVDESGNVIPNQMVTSNNAGPGSSPLQIGDVVEIELPIPQGVNLTQNIKVQTSYQTLATSAVSSLAERLNLKSEALKATTNSSTSTATYTLTTQGNNINLQLTPNQVYLTQKDSIQYGYLYNIGDLTASQITVTSSSPNVRVTIAEQSLGRQKATKITYELLNGSTIPATNPVTITAQNPSGQIEITTGTTNQNVNPDIVPPPTPTPTPAPTPSPSPIPPPVPGNLALTSVSNFIQLGNTTQATITLENSFGVTTPIPISISCNSSNINCNLSTSSCNLTTTNNSCFVNIQGDHIGNGALIATTTTSGYDAVGDFYTVGSSSDGSQNLYAPFKTGTFPNLTTTLNRCLINNNGSISGCSDQNAATGLSGYSYVYNMTVFNPELTSKYLYVPSRSATASYVYKCAVANDGTLGTACSDASNGNFSLSGLIEAGMLAQNINGQNYLFLGAGVAAQVYRCSMSNNGDLSGCSLGFDFNTIGNSAISGIRLWNTNGNLYLYAQGIIGKVYRCNISQVDASISSCTEIHQFNTPSPLTSMAFLQLNNHSYVYVSYQDSLLDPAPVIVEECTIDNLGGFTDCNLANANFTAPVDSGTYGSLNSLTSVAKNNQVYLYGQYQILDGYGIPTGDTSFEECLITSLSNLSCSVNHSYSSGVFSFSLF